jgi:hypothetical protein
MHEASLPVPEPVEHVIQPEERVEPARSEQPPSRITAWWFRQGAEPIQVAIDQFPHLITEDPKFCLGRLVRLHAG